MHPGDSVLVWSGPVPAGARVMSWEDAVLCGWMDVCILGQHLPQSYTFEEVVPLDVAVAEAHGLCVTCLGFGTSARAEGLGSLFFGFAETSEPCGECGGSGRSAMRVHIERTADTTTANIYVIDHKPVMVDGRCMACGMGPEETSARHL